MQAVHDVAFPVENCPVKQATGLTAAFAHEYPAGQFTHTIPVFEFLYEPGLHGVQIDAPAPLVSPSGHEIVSFAPRGQYEPAGHCAHALEPDAVEYDPP